MFGKSFQKITLLLITCYQILISYWTKPRCRFYPTCSNYAKEAVSYHGVIKGLYLTLFRLLRCHPFHSGGIDLVPQRKKKQSEAL